MHHNNQLVLFSSTEGNVSVDVKIEQDTVWLSLNQLEILFDRDKSVISRHIKNIFKEELDRESVVANFATTANDGKINLVNVKNKILITKYTVISDQCFFITSLPNFIKKNPSPHFFIE